MSTGLPRPGLARSAHRGRIKFLRGYVSMSSAAVNRPTHDHAASLSGVARRRCGLRRGPAHQLAVRMRINNFTHGHNYSYGPSNQPCTSHAPCIHQQYAEGLHFSAFHYTGTVPVLYYRKQTRSLSVLRMRS